MTIGLIFWISMLIGILTHFWGPALTYRWGFYFWLLFLVGWKVFGFVIQG